MVVAQRPDGDASEVFNGMADGLAHPADLPVAPFSQCQTDRRPIGPIAEAFDFCRRRPLAVGGVVIGQDSVEFSLLAHATLVEPDGSVALATEESVAVAGQSARARTS